MLMQPNTMKKYLKYLDVLEGLKYKIKDNTPDSIVEELKEMDDQVYNANDVHLIEWGD